MWDVLCYYLDPHLHAVFRRLGGMETMLEYLRQAVVKHSDAHQQVIVGNKEGNVLFNDALNTFYFTVIWRRTYGKGPLR